MNPRLEQLEFRCCPSALWVDPLPHHVEGQFYMRLLAPGWVNYPLNRLADFGIPPIEQHAPEGAVLPVAVKGMPLSHGATYAHPELLVLDHLALYDLGLVRTQNGVSYLQQRQDGLHAFFASNDGQTFELQVPAAWQHYDSIELVPYYTGP